MEENREINRLIQEELNRGTIGMEQQDFHLLKTTVKTLKTKPVDYLRGWLVDVYLARGEIHNAEKELQAIRTGPNYKRKVRTNLEVVEGVTKRKKIREYFSVPKNQT